MSNPFLIGPEHPDYLARFNKGFGAGESFPARLYPKMIPDCDGPGSEKATDVPAIQVEEDADQAY